MPTNNPFTRAANAVRSYMDAHWNALPDGDPGKVPLANRWGRTSARGARQTDDVPAVDMRPVEGRDMKFSASSSTGLFARAYELGIATGATPAADNPNVLDAVEWELIRVAARAAVEKLGLPDLVLNVALESSRHTPDDPEQNRGARRWSGVVVLVVTLQVSRASLIS